MLEDGSGMSFVRLFNEKEASASELRELKIRTQDLKKIMEDGLLLSVGEVEDWQGLTWEQRWQIWNRRFPDFARTTPRALRKACEYAEKNRERIQRRYEKLAQPPKSER